MARDTMDARHHRAPGNAPEGSSPNLKQRTASDSKTTFAEVTLTVSQVQEGAFVKITEYIPQHL